MTASTGTTSEEALHQRALEHIGRFECTEAALTEVLSRHLKRRGMDPDEYAETVGRVVARCVETGLVDDQRWATMKARSLLREGKGPRRIRDALAVKGVAGDHIEAAITDARDELGIEDDVEVARVLARRKRIGPWRTDAERRQAYREKDMAALARAGFSFDVARAVIEEDPEPR